MKSKTILTAVLLCFVVASIVFAIAKDTRKATPSAQTNAGGPLAENTSSTPDASPGKVILYYFHGNARCPRCMKFEAYSRESVETGFQKACMDGRLEFRVVNVEEPGNEHYVEDYRLYTKSIVVVEMKGDKLVRWNNLARIWELVGSKEKFIDYVQDEIRSYLDGV